MNIETKKKAKMNLAWHISNYLTLASATENDQNVFNHLQNPSNQYN